MVIVRSRQALTAAVFAAAFLSHLGLAQTPSAAAREATRAELEAKAHEADSLGRTQEAFALHTRLRDGDFDIGDRVLVLYEGLGLNKRDTLVVQSGRTLPLGDPMGDLGVKGVLRSELSDSITKRVARYYRDEVVHVTPLLRVSVAGAVRSPGVYYLPTDAPLSDLLARGGRDGNSNPENITIRRGDTVLWAKDDVQSALEGGLTLQQLNLSAGDELLVGERNQRTWVMPLVQIGLTAVALFMTLAATRKH